MRELSRENDEGDFKMKNETSARMGYHVPVIIII